MSMQVLDECIGCGVCVPECPNGAIHEEGEAYKIDAEKCTECVGHFEEAQCLLSCPVDCIAQDPQHVEDQDTLLAKFSRLSTH